ncbi:MAG: cupin domain-containing protein [Pseudomonadota bacterium]
MTSSGKAEHPQDALETAPDHHTVLLENERVRVLDTRLRAGEKTPIHSHEWPAALYILGWSDFVRRDADGNVVLDSRKEMATPSPGAVLWGPALAPHCVENVGDSDLHVIAVELKPQ